MTLQHEEYYIGFRDGDENALNYVYKCYYQSLIRHGKRIIDDEFEVSSIVQEAFLKGWKFRETMESMRHIYCFIRLDVSWKCYAYFRNPRNQFLRRMVEYGTVECYIEDLYEQQTEAKFFDEEKLKVIEEALPYLPANRQTIMALYFKHGFSYKKIARRFGTSGQAVTLEVQKSLESLKKIVHAQKKLDIKTPVIRQKNMPAGTENMDAEMQYIFKMRYEMKHSFATIAEKMNITQGYVQQQYVIAHSRLRELYRR